MLRALGRTFSRRRNTTVEPSEHASDGEQGLPTGKQLDDQQDNAFDDGSPTLGLRQRINESSALSSPDGVVHLGSVSQAVLDQKLERLRSYRISFQVDRYAESEAGESVVSDASRAFKPSPVREHPEEGTDVTVIKSPADAALRKVKVAFQNAAGSTQFPAMAAVTPAVDGHASVNGHAPASSSISQPVEPASYSTLAGAAEVETAGTASAMDAKTTGLFESQAGGRDSSTTRSDEPVVFSAGELLDSVSDVELSVESGLYVGSTRNASVTSQTDVDMAALGLPPGLWNRKARSAPPLLCANALYEEEDSPEADSSVLDEPMPALPTTEIEIPLASTNPTFDHPTTTPTMLSTAEVEIPVESTNPASTELTTAPTMLSTTELEIPPTSSNPAVTDLTTAPTMPYEPAENPPALPETEEATVNTAFPELVAGLPNISSPRTHPSAEFVSFNDLAHNSDTAAAGAASTELQGSSSFNGFVAAASAEAASTAPLIPAVQEEIATAAEAAGESFATAVETIAAEPATAEETAQEEIIIEDDAVPVTAFGDDDSVADVIGLSPIPEGNSRETTLSEAVPVPHQQPADNNRAAMETATNREANDADDHDNTAATTVLLNGAPSGIGLTSTASSAEMSVTVISPVTGAGEDVGVTDTPAVTQPGAATTEKAVVSVEEDRTSNIIVNAAETLSAAPQALKLESESVVKSAKETVVNSIQNGNEAVVNAVQSAQNKVANGTTVAQPSKVQQTNTPMQTSQKRKGGLWACFCGSE